MADQRPNTDCHRGFAGKGATAMRGKRSRDLIGRIPKNLDGPKFLLARANVACAAGSFPTKWSFPSAPKNSKSLPPLPIRRNSCGGEPKSSSIRVKNYHSVLSSAPSSAPASAESRLFLSQGRLLPRAGISIFSLARSIFAADHFLAPKGISRAIFAAHVGGILIDAGGPALFRRPIPRSTRGHSRRRPPGEIPKRTALPRC